MIEKFEDEIWKKPPVDNLDPSEKIEISNYGRIRSKKISEKNPKIIGGSWLTNYNVIVLKLTTGKKHSFYVHKLVAELFLKKDHEGQTYVVHRDYNRSNNKASNLFWADKAEMLAHRKKDKYYGKKKIRNSKLTESEVIRIKKMLKAGEKKPYRIALEFGISQTQLLRIRRGINWGHIKV